MKERTKGGGYREIRKDRTVQEYVHDSYKSRGKLPEPSLCPLCGAIYQKGRWIWGERPDHAHEEICPACHRLRDNYPAGFLYLSGPFLKSHEEEILNLAKNEEETAKKEHALSRMMNVQKEEGEIVITTTDMHLPRRIGAALKHAYQGTLDFHYIAETNILRVRWNR